MAFFATLDIALADKELTWTPTPDARDAHAAAFFVPPGGTNLWIIGDGSRPAETGRDAATNG